MNETRMNPEQYDELIIVLYELKKMGYSISLLAKRLEINQATFWYYTKGKRGCPVEVLERLKKFLEHEQKFNDER